MTKNLNVNEERDFAIINQIYDLRKEIDYMTRDFSIDFLVSKFKDGEFFIPSEYQRNFVWDSPRKCRFIESILLGHPIPFMFYSDIDDGRTEIIDGAQRTSTLEEFLDNKLMLSGLTKLTELNSSTFGQMPQSVQRKFSKETLRVIALKEGTTLPWRQEIFDRINTSSLTLKPVETRRGSLSGKFMDFLTKCAKVQLFKDLCPISEDLQKRYEDVELVLRFFAYANNYRNFNHRVDKFLDEYTKVHQHEFDEALFENEFMMMLDFVKKYFPLGFKKSKNAKSVPRTRFEAIAVGTILALRVNPNLEPAVPTDWADIFSPEGEDFKYHTTTHASNSRPRVVGRIEYVRDMLLTGKGRVKND